MIAERQGPASGSIKKRIVESRRRRVRRNEGERSRGHTRALLTRKVSRTIGCSGDVFSRPTVPLTVS